MQSIKIYQILVFCFLLLASNYGKLVLGQVPQKFNYQGIARDLFGNPLSNQKLSVKLSILPASDATIPEYEEIQQINTNEFGLYSLQIGNGFSITGDMNKVKWETGNKYIKVAIDGNGGDKYVEVGTTQLLSVPYAMFADKAGIAGKVANNNNDYRTGLVSSNSAHVSGDANYVAKFSGLNLIGKSIIYDNGTKVGIGTTTPLASGLLHLKSPLGTQPLILESPQGVHNLIQENGINRGYFGSFIGSGGAYPSPVGTTDADFDIGTSGGNTTGKLHLATNTTPRLTITPNTGDVGIGTTSPSAKLDVAGQVKISGGNPGLGKVLTSDASGLASWQAPSAASSVGSIFGFVELLDESGYRIYNNLAGTTVTIEGTTQVTTTDATGKFVFNNIPFGNYAIILSRAGYGNEIIQPVVHVGGINANYIGNASISKIPGFNPTSVAVSSTAAGITISGNVDGPNTDRRTVGVFIGSSPSVSANPISYIDFQDDNIGIGSSSYVISLTNKFLSGLGIPSGSLIYFKAYSINYENGNSSSYTDKNTGKRIYNAVGTTPSNVVSILMP